MTTMSPAFQHLFDKTKVICFGRFLVDVSLAAELVYGPTEAPLSIERYPNQAAHMEEIIALRVAEIEKDRYRAYDHLQDKDSMLGKVINGAIAKQKIVFGVSPSGGDFYRVESYLPFREDLFVQKINPYGAREDMAKAVQDLNAIARLLRSRSEQEIPVEAGVCTDGGFISDTKGLTHENLRLGIRLAEFSDVHFSIATTKKDFVVESDAIERRLEQAKANAERNGNGAWYSRIKILRRGPSTIEKWKGFEILARKPAQANAEESHEFAFLSQGEPQNPYMPVLDVKLHTGVKDNQAGKVRPSINDEEAVVLWDRLTNSIRVRSTALTSSSQGAAQHGERDNRR